MAESPAPPAPRSGRQPVGVGTAVGNAVLLFVRGCVRGVALHKVASALSRPRAGALRAMVGKCVFYNGVLFLGSMLLYDNVILPLVHVFFSASNGAVAERIVSAVYSVLWLWPLYLVTFAISSSLHSRIISEAVRASHTSIASQLQQQSSSSISSTSSSGMTLAGSLSDMSYKTLLYSVFAAQAMLIDLLIPVLGRIASFALTSLLYSFVCFDVKWSLQKPWRLSRRLDEFEARWAFFLGFGAPFTLSCFFFPMLANCGIYSLLFPFLELMSLDANEVEQRSTPPVHIFKPSERFIDIASAWIARRFGGGAPAQSAKH